MLDPAFTAIVRRHLRHLPPGRALDPEARLSDLGLDSMAAVALMFDLEDELGVELADHETLAETFRSAATLWTAVAARRAA